MYHNIEFRLKGVAAVEIPGSARVELVAIKAGTRLRALVKPHVVEAQAGPIEVADLCFEDGSIAHGVRFASFCFLDE